MTTDRWRFILYIQHFDSLRSTWRISSRHVLVPRFIRAQLSFPLVKRSRWVFMTWINGSAIKNSTAEVCLWLKGQLVKSLIIKITNTTNLGWVCVNFHPILHLLNLLFVHSQLSLQTHTGTITHDRGVINITQPFSLPERLLTFGLHLLQWWLGVLKERTIQRRAITFRVAEFKCIHWYQNKCLKYWCWPVTGVNICPPRAHPGRSGQSLSVNRMWKGLGCLSLLSSSSPSWI